MKKLNRKILLIFLIIVLFAGLVVFLFLKHYPRVKMETSGFIWGINGHPMQSEIYTHPWPKGIDFQKQFDLIKGLGTNWYRFGIKSWSGNIPPGESIFYYTDQFVNPAISNNINLVAILSPNVDFDGASNIYPANSAEFEALLSYNYQQNYSLGSQYSEHYNGKINYWQLGNEVFNKTWAPISGKTSPNNKIKYSVSNSGSFRFYREPTQVIQAAIKGLNDGIKSKNPNAKTILQSYWIDVPSYARQVSSGESQDSYCQDLVRDNFQTTDFHNAPCQDNLTYGVINADIAGWFWYSDMDNNLGNRFPGNDKNALFNNIGSLGKDIWIVEGNIKDGTCSSSDSQMSAYLKSSAQFFQNQGKVKAYFEYELLDEPYYLYGSGSSCGEGNYGLVKTAKDGTWQVTGYKESYFVYKDIITPPTREEEGTQTPNLSQSPSNENSDSSITPSLQTSSTLTSPTQGKSPSPGTKISPKTSPKASLIQNIKNSAAKVSTSKGAWFLYIAGVILILIGIFYLWRNIKKRKFQ